MDKEQLLQADIAGMASNYTKLEVLLKQHLEPERKLNIKERLVAVRIEADRLNTERAAWWPCCRCSL